MSDSYEDLTECALTPELEKKLVESLGECVFMWANKAGEPFGVVMSYLPKNGKLWLTCAEARARVPALRRFKRASICINSTGSKMGGGKTVTYKGDCIVRSDRETVTPFKRPRLPRVSYLGISRCLSQGPAIAPFVTQLERLSHRLG